MVKAVRRAPMEAELVRVAAGGFLHSAAPKGKWVAGWATDRAVVSSAVDVGVLDMSGVAMRCESQE